MACHMTHMTGKTANWFRVTLAYRASVLHINLEKSVMSLEKFKNLISISEASAYEIGFSQAEIKFYKSYTSLKTIYVACQQTALLTINFSHHLFRFC